MDDADDRGGVSDSPPDEENDMVDVVTDEGDDTMDAAMECRANDWTDWTDSFRRAGEYGWWP